MTNFNDFLNEQMKDPEFKAEWDALDPEFAVIEAILAARKESGLTQQQLSERTALPRQTSASWSAVTEILRFAPCSGWLPVWGCGSRSNLFRQSEPPSRWPAGCLLF